MGNYCGTAATVPSSPPPPPQVIERTTTVLVPQPIAIAERPPVPPSLPPFRTRSRTASLPVVTRHSGMSSHDSNLRSTMESAPQLLQFSKSVPPQNSRTRAQSVAAPKRSNRADSRPTGPEHSKSEVQTPSMSYPDRGPPNSTVKQALTDHPQFRILVLGKSGSGKSSLINAAFRVDMSATQARAPDINFAFRPNDNHHVIVHEWSGLEPGDAQGLRAIRDFISNRTDPGRAAPERLHAIWICVPAYDAIYGSIGEGVEEILSMRRVPAIVAFTKSDMAYPHITGSESGSFQYQDRARSRAYAQCEQLCRPLFRREPRDVPAELVSVKQQFGVLLNNLIVTTDRLIMGTRTASTSSRSSSQGKKPRIASAPLVWSVALRASRDITIEASIEVGRSRYWCSLWSSPDFNDQPLQSCVNIIHIDVVDIWNLYDKNRYLSSDQFKIIMSHVVKDLAVPAGGALSSSDWNVPGDKFADWVYDVYRGSPEIIRCVMGYIVDLTVILDDIFRTAASHVTESATLKATNTHIRSGRRDNIHQDIRDFVTATFRMVFADMERDLVLEKIIDLIRQYCGPPSRNNQGNN